MKLLWWVLFLIYAYMIIAGFFGIYNYILQSSVYIPKPVYMESILSYFKNGTVVNQSRPPEFPFFEIVLIAFGTIGFYLTSKFYREAKSYGFA